MYRRRDKVANCTLCDGTSFDIVLLSRDRRGSAVEGVHELASAAKEVLSSGTSGLLSDMRWLSRNTRAGVGAEQAVSGVGTAGGGIRSSCLCGVRRRGLSGREAPIQ